MYIEIFCFHLAKQNETNKQFLLIILAKCYLNKQI